MKLTFLGAAQEVTGSNFLLETDGTRLMVDCGLFQGSGAAAGKNYAPFPKPHEVKTLLITHAHLDHVGRTPRLYKDGFRGEIITHPATEALMRIVLKDEEGLIHRQDHPLFSEADLEGALSLVKTVPYGQWHGAAPARFRFHDAGHILGSAWIELELSDQTLLFSGDLGNPPVPFLRPVEPADTAQFLILESTYGSVTHEPASERTETLRRLIKATVQDQGVLLIPAFAIERAQEIIFEIDQMVEKAEIEPCPVFLDSPMAIAAAQVFRHHQGIMNPEAKELIAQGEDFFKFNGLKFTRTVAESKSINDTPKPKIIIAGSGMMQGGRITHHARRYLPFKETRIVFAGYQAKGTLGRELFDNRHHDGAFEVEIDGDRVAVHAQIEAIGAYSAHADQPKLLEFVRGMKRKPKAVLLTHGEPEVMSVLAHKLESELSIKVVMPTRGETVNLA